MGMARALFWTLLLSLSDRLTSTQECPDVTKATCDSMGNATLDTADLHRQCKDCEWSLREKEYKNLKNVKPSLNLTVQCRPEICVKVHCINKKKCLCLACYTLMNQTSTEAKSQKNDASHLRNRSMLIPVGLLLVVVLLLLCHKLKCAKS